MDHFLLRHVPCWPTRLVLALLGIMLLDVFNVIAHTHDSMCCWSAKNPELIASCSSAHVSELGRKSGS